MPDPSHRRDPREIVVPGDLRPRGPVARRPARKDRPGEFRAAFVALLRGTGRLCIARPGEVAGSLVALGAVAYVSVNALGLQAGPHPAPILPQPASLLSAQAIGPSPASAPVAAALVPARPVSPPTPPRETAEAPASRPAPPDAIAAVLRAPEDATASVREPDHALMRAQRMLAQLGYGALKADGRPGPATRAAIERFERDQKLPVTGQAAGRTLRALSARVSTKASPRGSDRTNDKG